MALGLSHPHSVFRAVQSVNTGPTGEPHHIRPYAVALKSCITTLHVQVSKTRLKMRLPPRLPKHGLLTWGWVSESPWEACFPQYLGLNPALPITNFVPLSSSRYHSEPALSAKWK